MISRLLENASTGCRIGCFRGGRQRSKPMGARPQSGNHRGWIGVRDRLGTGGEISKRSRMRPAGQVQGPKIQKMAIIGGNTSRKTSIFLVLGLERRFVRHGGPGGADFWGLGCRLGLHPRRGLASRIRMAYNKEEQPAARLRVTNNHGRR